jgi:hypothetical protein
LPCCPRPLRCAPSHRLRHHPRPCLLFVARHPCHRRHRPH